MARRVTLPPGSRVRLTVIAGIVGVVGVVALRHAGSDARNPSTVAEAPMAPRPADLGGATERPVTGRDRPDTPILAAHDEPLPQSCAALGAEDFATPAAAVVLAWQCPDEPLGAMAARALASSLASPQEAARAAPRLVAHPRWHALATFVAATRVAAPAGPDEPSPDDPKSDQRGLDNATDPTPLPAVAAASGDDPAAAPPATPTSPAPAGAGANVPIRDVPAPIAADPSPAARPPPVGVPATARRSAGEAWTSVPPPETAAVSPLDATVVWHAQVARTLLYKKGVAHGDRLRAHGYLAKAALEAALALGVGPGRPASPLAQLLLQIGLHHGRVLAQFYWRRRVAGLAPLLAQVEDALLAGLLALQSTPHAGDPARMVVERGRVRHYVRSTGNAKRIDTRAAQRPHADLAPASTTMVWGVHDEIQRWVAHGWVDRAVQAIVGLAKTPDGPGLGTLEQLLADAVVAADRRELVPRIGQRLAPIRASLPPSGVGAVPPRQPSAEPSAEAVADEAAAWLQRVRDDGPAFSRQHAAGRALLVLRTRPDATAVLLERVTAAPDGPLAFATPVLMRQLAAHDGRRFANLRLQAQALSALPSPDTVADAEARRRIRFAATLRAP